MLLQKSKCKKNMDHFSEACNNFGLTISTAKTEVMYQPAPQKAYSEPTITVGNETLKVTDRFCYLGSTLSSSANIDAEVENRIAKASSTFGRLRKTVLMPPLQRVFNFNNNSNKSTSSYLSR